tara:strand:- start:3700 stop:6213 length:2514 start_codon:yes stop_codon:yes gene_type:complete
MPLTGLLFEKETESVSSKILSLFEKVRVAYLSAKSDPKNYGSRWRKAVEDIRDEYDNVDYLGGQLQTYLARDIIEDKNAMNPESPTASEIYTAIKMLRFESDEVQDPFAKRFKGKVLEALMEDSGVMIKFIHYALRTNDEVLAPELYDIKDIEPDDVTIGLKGLDLNPDDIALYITEHYGDGKDSKKIESKFKNGLSLLKLFFLSKHSQEEWDSLLGVEIKKAEKSEEQKASIDFITPNKPMYRIFELEDINELQGFSGEWVVQEKYDGMRIQIHKIDSKITIYSYNEKDITDKCKDQVEVMKKKNFGDCILDAELILFDGDEALHRADTISHVFKNQHPDAKLRAHVFDIMRHDERSMAGEELRDRIDILFNNYSMHSDESLAFPSKKDTRIADNLKDVKEYSETIMEMPTAEGVVIKDITSTYYIGTKKNPKWIKWKKFVDLDLIVLDKKKTKSNMFSYTLGAGPAEGEGKHIQELNGIKYMNVGKANNTKLAVEIGDILRVKVDEVKGKDGKFTIYGSTAIEIPEVESPEKIITLEMLSKETKKSLKFKAKALEKGILITDHIHGDAILKSMDGFTIYEFEEDNLMSKHAMMNLDSWKSDAENIMKTKQSELTVGVFQRLKERGPSTVKELHNYLVGEMGRLYDSVLGSQLSKLEEWFNSRDGISFDSRTNKFFAEDDKIMLSEEEYKTPLEYRKGEFKIYSRQDDNLTLVMKLSDETLYWTIDINSDDDIFNLFGKAGKFPAQVATTPSADSKLIDEGDIELGIQRDGYHEYFLKGNKFETKIHFRVVPVDNKEMWLAWTGYKQEPADKDGDNGVWNINKDKYAKLILNSEKQ